ncbi:PH domain-containing protein [Tunicatimonas pelagia]|uniref:PH domain-containing protein n=1 Tax=Tunicatimonas pelagia TaxID=931531 RepID=UPI002664ED23|nr:PH domain-containing protein [Tunicatimonas pelagia]WKN42952.1 PH domain-containing protein [Tunicatimonas pelagia]
MKQTTTNTYRSTVGKFTFIVIILLIATLALSQYFFLSDAVGAIVTTATAVLALSILYFNLRYQITDRSLIISSLFSKKEIDIFQISSVRWVRSFYNQPNVYSFSEVRLRVVYSYGQYVDISPKHTEEFIETLLAVNPTIQLRKEAIMQE